MQTNLRGDFRLEKIKITTVNRAPGGGAAGRNAVSVDGMSLAGNQVPRRP